MKQREGDREQKKRESPGRSETDDEKNRVEQCGAQTTSNGVRKKAQTRRKTLVVSLVRMVESLSFFIDRATVERCTSEWLPLLRERQSRFAHQQASSLSLRCSSGIAVVVFPGVGLRCRRLAHRVSRRFRASLSPPLPCTPRDRVPLPARAVLDCGRIDWRNSINPGNRFESLERASTRVLCGGFM